MSDHQPADLTRLLLDASAGVEDATAFLLPDDPLVSAWYWPHQGSLSALKSLKARLASYIDSPETLFSPDVGPGLVECQRLLRWASESAFTWGEEEMVGHLASAQQALERIHQYALPSQKLELLLPNTEDPGLVVPTQLSLAELIRKLGPDPRAWHALGPRKFEELLAEIWAGLGWETLLTPPTSDGGFDVRAIRRSDGVTACYLIEAKAYDPSRPVGIEVVRKLYGVVERERATHGILATTSYFTRGAMAESRTLKYRVSLASFEQVLAWTKRYLQLKSHGR